MKSKKNIILLTCLILVVALVIVFAFLFNSNNIDNLLEDENAQVEILSNLYNDFLSEINTNDENIILDKSAQKNILTNEEFSEANLSEIKSIEKTSEDAQITYTVYTNYSDATHTVSIEIVQDDIGYTKHIQKYTLYVEDGKIAFERDGYGTTVQE